MALSVKELNMEQGMPTVDVAMSWLEAELTAANMTAWLKKNGCRRSVCVDVYTTKGIRFHEPNRIRFVRMNEVHLEQNQDIRIQDHVL